MHHVDYVQEAVLKNLVRQYQIHYKTLKTKVKIDIERLELDQVNDNKAEVCRKLLSAEDEEFQELNRNFYDLVHETNQLKKECKKAKTEC